MRFGCNLLRICPVASESGNAPGAMSGFGRGQEPVVGQMLNSAQKSTASDTIVSSGVAKTMRPRGHIQQRSPGSFRLRYTLGKDSITGKRRTATTTVRGTRKDAERELTRLLRTADTGEHVHSNRMTVGRWLELWLDTIRAEVSPKTHESYAEIVRCYLTGC
jgi:hypothetical protein